MTASVQIKSLRKMQIWLKTLILQSKSSKKASNSGRLSREWNKFQEPYLYFDVNFGAGLYGIYFHTIKQSPTFKITPS